MTEGKFKDRTKKENLLINRKITKMERIFGGVSNLTGVPAAVFIADAKKEISAVREAIGRGVKIMAIIDTNADPDGIAYVIPSNDDATKSLELLINTITEAIEEGLKKVKTKEAVSVPLSGTTASQGKKIASKAKKETKKKEDKPSSAKATGGKTK